MREFHEGSSASFTKTISEADVVLFADLTGDTNPLHIDAEYARHTRFGQRIAHGMLTAGLISTVIGTKLPGPGAIYMNQTLDFILPVHIGDTITATGTITSWDGGKGPMTIETVCCNQRDVEVIRGEARILYRP